MSAAEFGLESAALVCSCSFSSGVLPVVRGFGVPSARERCDYFARLHLRVGSSAMRVPSTCARDEWQVGPASFV